MQSNFNYHASRRGSVPDASANTTTPTNTGQGATDSVPNSRGISQAKPGTRARDEQLSALPRRRSRDESLSHQADQPEAQRPRVSPPPCAAPVSAATTTPQPRMDRGTSSPSVPKPELRMDLARKQYPALTGYLERLEAAYRSNTTLDPIEDIDHLAAIIKGLNIADPMLNLHFDKICAEDTPENIREYVLAQKLEAELRLEPRQRSSNGWREIIDDGGHGVAIDVRCSQSSNDVSIFLIESLAEDSKSLKGLRGKTWNRVLKTITSDIQAKLGPSTPPIRLRMTFFATNTRKSADGGSIFALSAAKKMASDPHIHGLQRITLRMVAGDGTKSRSQSLMKGPRLCSCRPLCTSTQLPSAC